MIMDFLRSKKAQEMRFIVMAVVVVMVIIISVILISQWSATGGGIISKIGGLFS